MGREVSKKRKLWAAPGVSQSVLLEARTQRNGVLKMFLMFVLSRLDLNVSSDGCLTTYQVSPMISRQPCRKCCFPPGPISASL